MLAYFECQLSWWRLILRTLRTLLWGDAQGKAAQLAYYFTLSLFPTLLCLVAFASLFPLQNLTDEITKLLQSVVPSEPIQIIRQRMVALGERNNTGLLSISLIAAVWSSSASLNAIINVMNRAYLLQETRPWWRVKLMTLVVGGPDLADALGRWRVVGPTVVSIWKLAEWPVVFLLVTGGISLIYYLAPDANQIFVLLSPGSLFASSMWLLGSLGFRYYVRRFGHYEATYGAIGGMIVVLLWFFVIALAIVLGAEMNAIIERASPWGTQVGDRKPGERPCIGAAASRRYRKSLAAK